MDYKTVGVLNVTIEDALLPGFDYDVVVWRTGRLQVCDVMGFCGTREEAMDWATGFLSTHSDEILESLELCAQRTLELYGE